MNIAKRCAVCGAFCALLIAIQYVFSAIKGVELISVFFFAFCFSFGAIYGVTVAVVFSLLRCFIYGFFPSVVILYLVFYPLFAFVAGLVGKLLKDKSAVKKLIFATVTVVVLTLIFSVLDDIITPLVFTFTKDAWMAYIVQSVPVCLIHCICSLITTATLFLPLNKVFTKLYGKLR